MLKKQKTSLKRYPNGTQDSLEPPPDLGTLSLSPDDCQIIILLNIGPNGQSANPKYAHLDQDGIVAPGIMVKTNEILVNKYSPSNTTDDLSTLGAGNGTLSFSHHILSHHCFSFTLLSSVSLFSFTLLFHSSVSLFSFTRRLSCPSRFIVVSLFMFHSSFLSFRCSVCSSGCSVMLCCLSYVMCPVNSAAEQKFKSQNNPAIVDKVMLSACEDDQVISIGPLSIPFTFRVFTFAS